MTALELHVIAHEKRQFEHEVQHDVERGISANGIMTCVCVCDAVKMKKKTPGLNTRCMRTSASELHYPCHHVYHSNHASPAAASMCCATSHLASF